MGAPLRVIFAGTPEFARAALERLHAAGHVIALVMTQPDRPAGRGMKLQASPVKQYAQAQGLPVAQPLGLRLQGKYPQDAQAAQAAIAAAQADVMVVAAYGLILPQWVLDAPRWGCLNLHASLLPRWRGAAPIHRAIEAGDAETGITVMQMDAGLDTGDMLQVQRLPIEPTDTTTTLHDKLADLGARMIVDAMPLVAAGTLVRTPQPEDGVTYAHKIEKSEAEVDWSLPAPAIERRLRAFDPFPGATSSLQGEAVKLWRAHCEAAPAGTSAGTILAVDAAGVHVACGEGALCLTQLQRAGGKRLAAADFLRGFPLAPGQRFGAAA
jgi:methionyl-tRNA formyltransferase